MLGAAAITAKEIAVSCPHETYVQVGRWTVCQPTNTEEADRDERLEENKEGAVTKDNGLEDVLHRGSGGLPEVGPCELCEGWEGTGAKEFPAVGTARMKSMW